jgi:hypothetical protein
LDGFFFHSAIFTIVNAPIYASKTPPLPFLRNCQVRNVLCVRLWQLKKEEIEGVFFVNTIAQFKMHGAFIAVLQVKNDG